MPRIYILLMSVLISAFYACDHRGKPYPATLLQIESLADTNPEEARPLLDRLRDSLSSFDEEQRPEQADAAVNAIMKIERGIAEVSFSREDLRDSQKNYNKMSIEDFKAKNDLLNWDVYFESMGMMDIKYLDAKQLSFYEGLSALMKNTTLDEQKYYLTFNLLSSAAPYLSDPFVAADFDFYGKTMSGSQPEDSAR